MTRLSNFVLAGPLLAFSVVHAQPSTEITIGERLSVHSEILDEDRPYWVHLPRSYEDDRFGLRSYPVLYLLDGDAHFHSASGVVQFMSAGINGNIQIPEMIVVAIPNTDRTRDLTPTHSTSSLDGSENPFLEVSGGGDNFLRFVRDELIGHIESTYRTLPYRILVGHSFGGLFAMHALTAAPDLFQAHIAIDPSLWWDDRVLVSRAEALQAHENLNASVYLTLADNTGLSLPEGQEMLDAGHGFAAALEKVQSPGLRSKLRYFEAENHGSVPLLSLYHGLLFVFDGFKPPDELLFNNPSAIGAHFERVSARLGVELLPPPNLMNQLGLSMLFERQEVELAMALFRFNAEKYPDSYIVHSSLAQGYEQTGETARAIESLERSLQLNPDNQDARDRLDALLNSESETDPE